MLKNTDIIGNYKVFIFCTLYSISDWRRTCASSSCKSCPYRYW